MNDSNIDGDLALHVHADKEHVEVIKELLGEIIGQIDKSCLNFGSSDIDVDNFVEAGLICLLKEVADAEGYHKLYNDLRKLRS